jgi:hypothetical protein
MGKIGLLGIVLACLCWGCGSTSRVFFSEPAGARLVLADQPEEHVFPIALDLVQTDDPEKVELDVGGRPIQLVLPGPDGLMLKGFLYVYATPLDQVERLAEVTFALDAEKIEKLRKGYAIKVSGFSPKGKPVFKVNVGIDRAASGPGTSPAPAPAGASASDARSSR